MNEKIRIDTGIDLRTCEKRLGVVAAACSVDLLTDDEVACLEFLTSAENPLAAANEYLESEEGKSLLLHLGELGFVTSVLYAGGNVGFYGVNPSARWAVHRRAQLVADREQARRDENRRVLWTIFGGAVAAAIGSAATVAAQVWSGLA